MYNFELPDKTVDEDKTVTFKFDGEANAAGVLSNPVIAKALIDGTDTGAASLTVGAPTVSGLNVLVLVSGGTEANEYGFLCSVDEDDGEKHQLGARMLVTVNAA